ncbi:MAG: type II secretion system protein GspG [Gemmatimonadota bacterium]
MIKKLILLLLIAFGAAMAIPSTRARLEERAAPVINRFKAKLVPSRLEAMADQLEARLKRGEKYPGNFAGWLNRDYSGVPEDPWGTLYYLETSRSGFTVGSAGPDRKPNTADDIKVTRRLRR